METGEYGNLFFLTTFTISVGVFIHYLYKKILKNDEYQFAAYDTEKDIEEMLSKHPPEPESTEKPQISQIQPTVKIKKRVPWKNKTEFTHPWLLKNLKGHPGTVLHMDFSANGKFLAATCGDGSVMIWDIRDLTQKEHKTLRVNIEFDHASHVVWSPDSKAFIVHTVRENKVVVYKLEKKKDSTIGTATQVIVFDRVHSSDIVGLGISSNGKFIMTSSTDNDLVIWDLKGTVLENINTYLMTNYSAKISPCGRFVMATGFTSDVKVLEVCFAKNGQFSQVCKAFELTGHSSGIYDVAFDVDTSHIATISKDGTWKLYYTKVQYKLGESPHVLETGSYSQTAIPPKIALSPNAEVLAVSANSDVEFFDTYTGEKYDTIEDVVPGPITYLKFDASGKYLFVCGDRVIRIFHNVCGLQTTINSCKRLLAIRQTSATTERLNKTIEANTVELAKFNK